MDWISQTLHGLVALVETLGYPGLFVMTLIDATIIPIPIEATLLPAGYLIHQGQMEFIPALIVSVAGTVAGSILNYWLASHIGRAVLLRYGRYIGLRQDKIAWVERFFAAHGPISVFTGRLIPGLRHTIALPAGLARMPMRLFVIYSTLGGIVTASVLLGCGYLIGASQEAAAQYLPWIKLGLALVAAAGVTAYVLRYRRRKRAL